MEQINKAKSISIWIFIVPFIAINACLIVTTQFHSIIESQQYRLPNMFPYFDGQASISRTARFYPTYLIFKPAMFLTSYLLIRYWLYNKSIICYFDNQNKNINKFVYFGIASAIALTIHSIFLGIKFDNDFYKLFRRVIMLVFIIFEIVAQAYLVKALYSINEKIYNSINKNILKLKLFLVTTLIIVAVISIPIISLPGDNFLGINLKFLKHALEWDYFLGVISFYLLTFFMWKKIN
tara:strand:- start:609 stop:1319 length:711 start_codon:yes stop_codon:yes gene_type:complete